MADSQQAQEQRGGVSQSIERAQTIAIATLERGYLGNGMDEVVGSWRGDAIRHRSGLRRKPGPDGCWVAGVDVEQAEPARQTRAYPLGWPATH